MLEGRIHRRDLLDRATEGRQRPLEPRTVDRRVAALDHLAFSVAGIGAFTEPDPRLIVLVRVQQNPGQLGRLAQTDRQHPRSQGIETPGMTGLFGLVQALDLLQGLVGTQPERFVEQQNTGHRPPRPSRFAHRRVPSLVVRRRRFGVPPDRFTDQCVEAIRLTQPDIGDKAQIRDIPQPQSRAQRAAQTPGAAVQA